MGLKAFEGLVVPVWRVIPDFFAAEGAYFTELAVIQTYRITTGY